MDLRNWNFTALIGGENIGITIMLDDLSSVEFLVPLDLDQSYIQLFVDVLLRLLVKLDERFA